MVSATDLQWQPVQLQVNQTAAVSCPEELLCVHATPRFVVTGSAAGLLLVFDRRTGERVGAASVSDFVGAADGVAPIVALCVEANEGRVAVVVGRGASPVIMVVSLPTSDEGSLQVEPGKASHNAEVAGVCWLENRVVSADADGVVSVLDPGSGPCAEVPKEESAVVQLDSDGKSFCVYSTLRRSVVICLDPETKQPRVYGVGSQLRHGVHGACVLGDAVYAARPRKEVDYRLWDAEIGSGKVRRTLRFIAESDADSAHPDDRLAVHGGGREWDGVYVRAGVVDGLPRYLGVEGGVLCSSAGRWVLGRPGARAQRRSAPHEGRSPQDTTGWEQREESCWTPLPPMAVGVDRPPQLALSSSVEASPPRVGVPSVAPFLRGAKMSDESALLTAWGDEGILILDPGCGGSRVSVPAFSRLQGVRQVVVVPEPGGASLYALHSGHTRESSLVLSVAQYPPRPLTPSQLPTPLTPEPSHLASPVQAPSPIQPPSPSPPPEREGVAASPLPPEATRDGSVTASPVHFPEAIEEASPSPAGSSFADASDIPRPPGRKASVRKVVRVVKVVRKRGASTASADVPAEEAGASRVVRRSKDKDGSTSTVRRRPKPKGGEATDSGVTPVPLGDGIGVDMAGVASVGSASDAQPSPSASPERAEPRPGTPEDASPTRPLQDLFSSPITFNLVVKGQEGDGEDKKGPVGGEDRAAQSSPESTPPVASADSALAGSPQRILPTGSSPPSTIAVPAPAAPPPAHPAQAADAGDGEEGGKPGQRGSQSKAESIGDRQGSMGRFDSGDRGSQGRDEVWKMKSELEVPEPTPAPEQVSGPSAELETVQRLTVLTREAHVKLRDIRLREQSFGERMTDRQLSSVFATLTLWLDALLPVIGMPVATLRGRSSTASDLEEMVFGKAAAPEPLSPGGKDALRIQTAELVEFYLSLRLRSPATVARCINGWGPDVDGSAAPPPGSSARRSDEEIAGLLLVFLNRRGLFTSPPIDLPALASCCNSLGNACENYFCTVLTLDRTLPSPRLPLPRGYMPHPQGTPNAEMIAHLWQPLPAAMRKRLEQPTDKGLLTLDSGVVGILRDSGSIVEVLWYLPYLFAVGTAKALHLSVALFPRVGWKNVRMATNRAVQRAAHEALGMGFDTEREMLLHDLYLDYLMTLAQSHAGVCKNSDFVAQYVSVLLRSISSIPAHARRESAIAAGGALQTPGAAPKAPEEHLQERRLKRRERIVEDIVSNPAVFTYDAEELASLFVQHAYYRGLLLLGREHEYIRVLLERNQLNLLFHYFQTQGRGREDDWVYAIKQVYSMKRASDKAARIRGEQQSDNSPRSDSRSEMSGTSGASTTSRTDMPGPVEKITYIMCVCLGPLRSMELLQTHLRREVEYDKQVRDMYKKLAILAQGPRHDND
eukprot:Hpha_TRINITY_DN12702_c0_g1::TRINITY_DN12702_c0_g1_i1::g.114232::m.114232